MTATDPASCDAARHKSAQFAAVDQAVGIRPPIEIGRQDGDDRWACASANRLAG